MKGPSFTALLGQAWRLQLGDPWLRLLMLWLPPVLFFLLWAIMSAGQARDLPIAVIDLDNSPLSRSLVRHYDLSPSLAVTARFPDVAQAGAALRAGTVYALVILPAGLETDARRGRLPQVTAQVNNQYLLVGRMINSALAQAHGDAVTRLKVRVGLAESGIATAALAAAAPYALRLVPLYNVNTDYSRFLVSAMLPAAWQILTVAAAVLALATTCRRSRLQDWPGPRPIAALFATLLPPFTLFAGHGLLFNAALHLGLGWPMRGSWGILIAAQLLSCSAMVSAGALCYFLTLDGARGLSLAAAYSAPGLAFMGVTYPAADMNHLAALWRQFMPVSHYIEIYMAQAHHGATPLAVLPQFAALALFLLLLLLPMARARSLARSRGPLTT